MMSCISVKTMLVVMGLFALDLFHLSYICSQSVAASCVDD